MRSLSFSGALPIQSISSVHLRLSAYCCPMVVRFQIVCRSYRSPAGDRIEGVFRFALPPSEPIGIGCISAVTKRIYMSALTFWRPPMEQSESCQTGAIASAAAFPGSGINCDDSRTE
jgi:hypothetical protein